MAFEAAGAGRYSINLKKNFLSFHQTVNSSEQSFETPKTIIKMQSDLKKNSLRRKTEATRWPSNQNREEFLLMGFTISRLDSERYGSAGC